MPIVLPDSVRFAVTLLLLVASPLVAQSDAVALRSGTTWLLGLSAGAYESSHPRDGAGVIGATLGVERAVSTHLAVRATLSRTVISSIGAGDDVSMCTLLPDGSCRPDALFPHRLWTLELGGVARATVFLPVGIFVGSGLALPVHARQGLRVSPSIDTAMGVRAAVRVGAELSLGRPRHALRLQVARSGYSRPMVSANGLTTVALVLPL